MKKINFIIIMLFITFCKAQTPIRSLYGAYIDTNGVYYKDIYNDFDKFVGTWKYTNGATSLTIVLQKQLKHYEFNNNNGDDYYLDVLFGEYKYVESGIEKINTLPQLSQNLDDPYKHNIFGSIIVGPNSQYCLNCGPNDRKVLLAFNDPYREIEGYEPQMMFQRTDIGGVQKLKLIFRSISGRIVEEGVEPPYTSYTVPFGEYLLVKQ